MQVGPALNVGRSTCMALVKVNVPNGPPYQRAMRRWLDDNGFGALDPHERANCIWIFEHETEVRAWRAGLSEVARRLANHPNTVRNHMRAGSVPTKSGPKQRQQHVVQHRRTDAVTGQYGPRPTRPCQDLIRKVADAMRLSGKRDWYALATIAVEVLSLQDLRDLMPAKLAPSAPIQHELEFHV